jgi:hypothetical protein
MVKKSKEARIIPVPVNAMSEALISWKGRPTLLTEQVDLLHGKAPKHTGMTVRRLIERGRLVEGRDFIRVRASELRGLELGGYLSPNSPSEAATASEELVSRHDTNSPSEALSSGDSASEVPAETLEVEGYQTSTSQVPAKPSNVVASGDTTSRRRRGNPSIYIYLILESGYFRIIKTFDDDLAWDIYEQVLDAHFKAKPDILDPFVRNYLLPLNAEVDPNDPLGFYAAHAPNLIDALKKSTGAPILGQVVCKYIYKPLLPEERLYEELCIRNQKDEDSGRRKQLHYQHITRIGKEQVLIRCHEISVLLFAVNYNWKAFKERYWSYYGPKRLQVEFHASERRLKNQGQLSLEFEFPIAAVAK